MQALIPERVSLIFIDAFPIVSPPTSQKCYVKTRHEIKMFKNNSKINIPIQKDNLNFIRR